jgi:hypothetical protein
LALSDIAPKQVVRRDRAAGVEGGHRADGGEGLVAGPRVGHLVGGSVGAAVEQEHLELAAADVGGGVEVGGVGAGGVLPGLHQPGHRAGDVGGVGDHDLVVGDARLVLEPVATARRDPAAGRVVAVGLRRRRAAARRTAAGAGAGRRASATGHPRVGDDAGVGAVDDGPRVGADRPLDAGLGGAGGGPVGAGDGVGVHPGAAARQGQRDDAREHDEQGRAGGARQTHAWSTPTER